MEICLMDRPPVLDHKFFHTIVLCSKVPTHVAEPPMLLHSMLEEFSHIVGPLVGGALQVYDASGKPINAAMNIKTPWF
jgi:hypothetical protein